MLQKLKETQGMVNCPPLNSWIQLVTKALGVVQQDLFHLFWLFTRQKLLITLCSSLELGTQNEWATFKQKSTLAF